MFAKNIKILLLGASALLASCLKNDIPYPVVEMDILSIAVEGASGDPVIDPLACTVVVPLAETTDIQNVDITAVEYTEGARPSDNIVGRHDMRYPLYVTLSYYPDQDYRWTITATQHIDRRFTVAGQIGDTEWDVEKQTAKVFRRADFGLDTVTVTSLRLGPRPVYDYPEASTLRNFNTNPEHERTVMVSSFGRNTVWQLYVEPKEIQVDITRAVAGAEVIWLKAVGVDGAKTGFRYRVKGDTDWIEADESWYSSTGGTIEVTLRHLAPQTEYEVVGYAQAEGKEEMTSEVKTLTTSETFPLPNHNFEEWEKYDNVWYPGILKEIMQDGKLVKDTKSPWWGTGNPASKIANVNLTEPSSAVLPPNATGYSVQMKSQNVGLFGIAKFAAGNLFSGAFGKIQGTNGLVDFGRPYTLRPTGLRGWVKYQQGIIDTPDVPDPNVPKAGAPDEGKIFIALGDWDSTVYGGTPDSPVRVDTSNKSTFFTPENAGIIAYGEAIYTKPVNEWEEFEIPLVYRDFDRTPTHIIIVATGSRFGDYFVGSTGTTMWVDDFELLYDLE